MGIPYNRDGRVEYALGKIDYDFIDIHHMSMNTNLPRTVTMNTPQEESPLHYNLRSRVVPIVTKPQPQEVQKYALFFDTETTGLFGKGNLADEDYVTKSPHILQLSFVLYNLTKGKIDTVFNEYIRVDDNVTIHEGSVMVHGITREVVESKGVPILDALVAFYQAYKRSNVVIAHNIKFDIRMIQTEVLRNYHAMEAESCLHPELIFNEIYETAHGIQQYCTMTNSIDLCNILRESMRQHGKLQTHEIYVPISINGNMNYVKMYKKFPSLGELHLKLFDSLPCGLHDAMEDVNICMKCYFKLMDITKNMAIATS